MRETGPRSLCENLIISTSAVKQFAEKRRQAFVAAVPQSGTAIAASRTTDGASKGAATTGKGAQLKTGRYKVKTLAYVRFSAR
jgi:hypothetical protein